MASVRMPTPAPQPKEGRAPEETQQPTNIASLFGNLFNTKSSAPTSPPPPAQAAAPPAAEPSEQVALRGTNTEMAAKPKRPEATRVAAAPISLQAKPEPKASEPKPQRVAAQPKQDSVWDQPKPEPAPAREPAKPTVVAKAEPVAKPAAVAKSEPAAKPPHTKVAVAAKPPAAPAPAPAREPEIRTAYSGTTTGSGLLTGAQPVVPAGSFNSFR